MSFYIKFKDLLNLALGTPDPGVVNFNALHILLNSIIEHLHLEEQLKVLPGNEKDYRPPDPLQVPSREKTEVNEEDLLCRITSNNIIGTLEQRLSVLESQVAFLKTLPSTDQLLESSQTFRKPAQEMWQMLKLKKQVEGNEEGMTKAMQTLQDLLSTISSLQSDTGYFKMELDQLKEKVDKISLDEVNQHSQELKDQQEQVKSLQLDMEDVKNKLCSFPDGSDIMQWTALHDAMYSHEDDQNNLSPSPDQSDIVQQTTSQDAMYSHVDTKETPEKAEGETSAVTPEVTSEETPKPPKTPKTPETRMPSVKTVQPRSGTTTQKSDPKASPLGKALVAMGITVGPETLTSMGIAIDPGILSAMGITTDPQTLAAMGINPVLGAGLGTARKPGVTTGPFSFTGPTTSTGPSASTAEPQGIPPGVTWNASSFLDALGVTPNETTLRAMGIDTNADSLSNLGSMVDPATLVALAILTGKELPPHLYSSAPLPTLPEVPDTTTESKPAVVPEFFTSPDTTAGEGTSAAVTSQASEGILPSTRSLKQLPTGPSLSAEGKRLTAKRSVGSLINLPIEYDSLKEQLAKLEDKVQQQANSLANLQFLSSLGLTPKLETEMSTLQDKITILQETGQKNKTYEQHLEKVQQHCNLLEKVTETLQDKMEDIKGLKIVVKQLEMRKVDKARMEEEMKEKADKSALAFKASRADLEFATVQLNDMMHDMLQKMSVHKQDWQKVLAKLFLDVDSKLDHMDLDPVKRQMEYIWKFVKKNLSEGPRFDADSAAGFKKQLFERVKCISCDRPVDMMTSPQLISIQKANLCPRARPISANSYEYLQRLKLRLHHHSSVSCSEPAWELFSFGASFSLISHIQSFTDPVDATSTISLINKRPLLFIPTATILPQTLIRIVDFKMDGNLEATYSLPFQSYFILLLLTHSVMMLLISMALPALPMPGLLMRQDPMWPPEAQSELGRRLAPSLCWPSFPREQQRLQQQQPTQETTNFPEQANMPAGGHPFWDNSSSLRRVMKIPNLTTLYPYGDPSVFPAENSEVNILGVDGVMYKGRMASRGAPRPVIAEKDLTGLKTPRPPSSRSGCERVRSSISNTLYPASRSRTSMTAQVLQQFALQPLLPSGILQHSSATRSATSGGPISVKPNSASLPLRRLNPTSSEEGPSIQEPFPSYQV
ncbi:uncharacterized protein C16orf96 homolog [Dromiciops gliroides]|uniref:uncharacterized protein C16orf96 homolog n=1 Tax=Dromiciops gliroides TaxID=33562 RepID=UPI001CC417A8|nr:uncharacterized protein C16orf96 homolog [Dromiciops gliroides]